jgi:hypothetical protein
MTLNDCANPACPNRRKLFTLVEVRIRRSQPLIVRMCPPCAERLKARLAKTDTSAGGNP